MFSQFLSLRELQLTMCEFPSFCAFRHVLVALPALKSLLCEHVHWGSEPQAIILPIPSKRPALQSLSTTFTFRGCLLAFLEWLVQTPTRSTLVEWNLEYPVPSGSQLGPDRTINYYAQIFAPHIRRLSLINFRVGDATCTSMILPITTPPVNIFVVICSQSVRARLHTLHIKVLYDVLTLDTNSQEKVATLNTNGLELFDLLLSRDNFKDLNLLAFTLEGYRDICRGSALEAIQRKLPVLRRRGTVDIQVDVVFSENFRPRPLQP